MPWNQRKSIIKIKGSAGKRVQFYAIPWRNSPWVVFFRVPRSMIWGNFYGLINQEKSVHLSYIHFAKKFLYWSWSSVDKQDTCGFWQFFLRGKKNTPKSFIIFTYWIFQPKYKNFGHSRYSWAHHVFFSYKIISLNLFLSTTFLPANPSIWWPYFGDNRCSSANLFRFSVFWLFYFPWNSSCKVRMDDT